MSAHDTCALMSLQKGETTTNEVIKMYEQLTLFDDDNEVKQLNHDKWIEKNCRCGVSEDNNEWSDDVFDLFGCTCEPDAEK